jgi:hypothetical protein
MKALSCWRRGRHGDLGAAEIDSQQEATCVSAGALDFI